MVADCSNRKCFQRRVDLDLDKYPDKNITYIFICGVFTWNFNRKVFATFLGNSFKSGRVVRDLN